MILEVRGEVQSDRTQQIIIALQADWPNLRDIAVRMGFSSHLEMANYMKSKGYQWSEAINNYIPATEVDRRSNIPCRHANSDKLEQPLQQTNKIQENEAASLIRYLPLLEFLESHFDNLQELLGNASNAAPTAQMLEQMIQDFSEEKGLNRQQVIECALMEFFQKRGYPSPKLDETKQAKAT